MAEQFAHLDPAMRALVERGDWASAEELERETVEPQVHIFTPREGKKPDSAIACPINPDKICPARALLVDMYTPEEPEEGDDAAAIAIMRQESDEENGMPDSRRLSIKLGENTAAARLFGCDGPLVLEGHKNESCPTRVRMNESTTRSLAVRAFRAVRAKVAEHKTTTHA